MVEIITRSTDANKIDVKGLLDWDALATKAAEIWCKRQGIQEEIKEVETLQRGLAPQVSFNSNGRIVIRLIPWIQLTRIKLKGGRVEELPGEIIEIPDNDVLIILDYKTSRELYEFLRTVEIDFYKYT